MDRGRSGLREEWIEGGGDRGRRGSREEGIEGGGGLREGVG